MQSFICGKFIDKYLIASRFSNTGAIISEKIYCKLLESSKINSEVSLRIIELLATMGFKTNPKQKLNDIILVKKPADFSFGKASYEITETCNYKCGHCYLGQKRKNNLSVSDKKKIIELIERSGCLWLQITGGEPFWDKDFIEVYQFAQSLGFLITLSTNGSLLTKHRIAEIIEACPPYRLTISAYGATAESYESLTGVSRSFKQFTNGIELASKTKIRTRLNIIATKYNQNEIINMVDLAKNFGFEYYVFSALYPTIYKDSAPIELMSHDCESIKGYDKPDPKENHYVQCKAGETFFHINSVGEMSICKTARKPSINLLQDGTAGFLKLSQISKEFLGSPSLCDSCELRKNCTTCPPILRLYPHNTAIPSFVCKKYYLNDFKQQNSNFIK